MKKEYDFSKGERGKFHRPNATLNLPVYLEPAVQARLSTAALKRREDVSTLVIEEIFNLTKIDRWFRFK